MKYTEKIGEVETVYEGTPSEIMELYIKMNPEEPEIDLIEEDSKVKEHYDNLKHFGVVELDTNEIVNELVRKMQLALSRI